MSGGFSFPPPPPPPPKASAGRSEQPDNFQGRGRGRGRGGFDQRGRGNGPMRGDQRRGGANGVNASSRGAWQSSNGPIPQPGQIPQRPPVLPPGSYVNPNFAKPSTASYSLMFGPTTNQSPPASNSTGSLPRTAAGHKRKLEALRDTPKDKKPAPPTVPATPSFGGLPVPPRADDWNNSNGVPDPSQRQPNPGSRSLGLTPGLGDVEYSSSSDGDDDDNNNNDVDEEALYAELGDKLTFEHNGAVISLTSQADLVAWKKERQKKWPTHARALEKEEERKKIGRERRRLLASAAFLRQHPPQRPFDKKSSSKVDSENNSNKVESEMADGSGVPVQEPSTEIEKAKAALSAQTKQLEQLRRKVAESEARNRRAQAQLEKAQGSGSGSTVLEVDEAPQDVVDSYPEADSEAIDQVSTHNKLDKLDKPSKPNAADADSSNASTSSSTSDDSSDISSDSDSDDQPPEVITSKPFPQTHSGPQRVCRYFSASGHCRDGDACSFRHEISNKAPNLKPQIHQQGKVSRQEVGHQSQDIAGASQKKTILGRLMEQEQDGEARLALQAIIYLGDAGFFRIDQPFDT